MEFIFSTVPDRPGVYLFKGVKEKVLYVGKAKNLRNRLRSYFQNSANLDARKRKMVKTIRDFSYIVTTNELEALILESNLIKQYKPRYNIILRDDKNYPYIKLSITEKWPKIEVVRRITNDGNLYFGPYIPAQGMWEAIDFIRRNFLLRTCGYTLEKNIRPCVQFQMKKCPAPCSGRISRDEYMKTVEDVRLFLSGEQKELFEKLEGRMLELSEHLRFEEAAKVRDRIISIKKAFESQKVISAELGDIDVIGYYKEADDIVIQVLFIRNGVLIGAKEFFPNHLITDDEKEIMHSIIGLFYSKEIVIPPVILTNCVPDDIDSLIEWLRSKRGGDVSIEVPVDSKMFSLLKMANENARLIFYSKRKPPSSDAPGRIKEMLGLESIPATIGAFDVSTIQGNESVGAYVYWNNGEFMKDKYRLFKIKGVTGIDDYAMMREIVERAFRKELEDAPSLIIIDGGKAQLSVAKKVIDTLNIGSEIIAIAKKPDRAFLPNDRVIPLDDKSAASAALRRIRDEVHRFAITYHRKLRGKKLMVSPLEEIPGIGKKRRLELLRHFGSIDNIRKSSIDEIVKIKGFNQKTAEKILESLNSNIEK